MTRNTAHNTLFRQSGVNITADRASSSHLEFLSPSETCLEVLISMKKISPAGGLPCVEVCSCYNEFDYLLVL